MFNVGLLVCLSVCLFVGTPSFPMELLLLLAYRVSTALLCVGFVCWIDCWSVCWVFLNGLCVGFVCWIVCNSKFFIFSVSSVISLFNDDISCFILKNASFIGSIVIIICFDL